MARLHRRGIGKVNIENAIHRDQYLKESFEALDMAYEKLWADAEKGPGEEQNLYWDLSCRMTARLLVPVVRETVAAMNRSLLSAIMFWNAGECHAQGIAERAGQIFEEWFREKFLPTFEECYKESDRWLFDEFDKYICRTMENDGVHPVHLRYFSTEEFYEKLRSVMEGSLLSAAKERMALYVPEEIRDTHFGFIRRRRLRKGVESFFAAKKAEGESRYSFAADIIVDDELVLLHANTVLKALRGSIWAEKFRLMGEA